MRRATTTLVCLTVALALAACGGSSSHPVGTTTLSSSQSPPPSRVASGGATSARAALAALQQAVRDRDVNRTCGLLLPETATQAHGSAQAIEAAIAAQVKDCETGFGQRGEFKGYAPLTTAKVTRVAAHGRLTTIYVDTDRGPAALRFLDLNGRWRMLVIGS